MSRYTLYAFANGDDLEDVAKRLETRFRQFVSGRLWIAGQPTVVNQLHRATVITNAELGDLWRLGLTVELPEMGTEFPKWYVDVEAIAQFLGVLHREFGIRFSLGFVDCETDRHEELFDVSNLPVVDGVSYVV